MSEHDALKHAEVDFHHPYEPYEIQKHLMLALYDCLDAGKVGIFESPTGTGKSLSLLCASLTWLRNHKKSSFLKDVAADQGEDEPEWMREHAKKTRRQDLLQRRNDLESKLEAIRQKEQRIRQRTEQGPPAFKRAKVDVDSSNKDDDAVFMLDDYESDSGKPASRKGRTDGDDLSSETKALLNKLGLGPPGDDVDGDADLEEETKVFICSRTHSQLSQLVGELHRVTLPSAFPLDGDEDSLEYPMEQVRQLSLGSRKNLCINKKVNSLGPVSQINERCLELQESKTPADRRCQYLPNKENEALALDFKHYALSKIRDIEDLAELGTRIGICPYYASRSAITPAEVIMLPYPLLLQKTAREALTISVKDHVVIIDEAHNLMDAILGIYTAEITLAQLRTAREQLMTYLQKFRNRLAGKNRVYVTQTVRLLDSLKTCLESIKDSGEGVTDSGSLLVGKGVDQINLYKLIQYLQESKLARKVHGYTIHQTSTAQNDKATSVQITRSSDQTPVLNIFQNFIHALTNPAKEGRFFYQTTSDPHATKLKYLLLDPSQHFHDIVTSARSVILCGGTMSPITDYLTQLFPYLPASRITTLSCSHVIPPSNLHVTTLSTGPSSTPFDFSFSARSSPLLLSSLGQTLLHLLPLIPDGVVLFFPSYSYLDTVLSAWRRTAPNSSSLLSQIERIKPSFIDARTANTEALLREYAAAIDGDLAGSHKGALLLSVIGGKLSEGINFSDRLGRCVIVVGMPWPNPNSAEWKARMEYIEEKARNVAEGRGQAEMGTGAGGKRYVKGEASKDFAENVCMRAVNQAIGRAIRHKGDWAGIVLIDRRYRRESVRGKLPGWIRGSLEGGEKTLEEVEMEMRGFYRRKLVEG
ncbi:hypothetical protein B9Z65_5397 [Elsinoe australis]|uniref:ATP-dependent DNA helicase CHL1 n=1 Tax=Elsinoe australis TaxID=40998 RepID=A0A2P7ZDZ0_9PEZI|nr:hypothetical protein B9Z65_5397 [Elsinoe australis]